MTLKTSQALVSFDISMAGIIVANMLESWLQSDLASSWQQEEVYDLESEEPP